MTTNRRTLAAEGVGRKLGGDIYQSFLVVRGGAPFPLDMLRYDGCLPARDVDAQAIERSINREGELRHPVVLLRRLAPTATGPTVARWASFCWHVLYEGERCPSDDEVERLSHLPR